MKRVHQRGQPDPRSILVVLPTWVGDFVMATPTLRAIRQRFADAHITFLVEPNLRDLVRGGDWMNECIEWPVKNCELRIASEPRAQARGQSHRAGARCSVSPFALRYSAYRHLVRDLRRRRFDWAVVLPNSFRSALIARLAGAKRRIGYDRDGRGLLLTDRLPIKNRRRSGMGKRRVPHPCEARVGDRSTPNESVPRPFPSEGRGHSQVRVGANLPVAVGRFTPMPLVEYYADLAEALDCERPDDRLELFTTPDCDEAVQERLASLGLADHRPLVVVSPGAKYGAAKCWFPDRFAAVADRLIETEDAAVVITCGPGEEPIARQIGLTMKGNAFVFDDPLLTLGQLKSLIRRSDLLICNDAGPRHFAKAFDIPVVTVFGPTHPVWTATSYEGERIVRIDVDCGPCQQRICPLGHLKCMTGVSVDAVFEASTQLLHARALAVSESHSR